MRFASLVSMLVMSLALNAHTIQGKVFRVSDGDTITILDEAKVENKIRLNLIDAPEKGQTFGDMGMIISTNITTNGPFICHNVDTIRLFDRRGHYV